MDTKPICEKCFAPLEKSKCISPETGITSEKWLHPGGFLKCSVEDDLLAILKNPRLFEIIIIDELGKKIVGENETKHTIFLCGCGIWVENHDATSYNLMQSAEGGAGKDYTLNATLSIFPKERYMKRTRISGKVISYWHRSDKEPEWTWNGIILYLEDASQELMNSEVVKVFLSSGSFATILINQVATDLEIKGKPVVMISSATAKLNKEQGRRVPILRCDESHTQTKKIMGKQARAAAEGKVITYNPKITEALSHLKRIKVKIPFAVGIEKAIPANNIILRTHFPRLLDYIKASCALHQYQRRVVDEYYLAEQRDYELAAIAFRKITSNPFSIPLSHQEQKLLEKIEELQAPLFLKQDFDGFTVEEIAQHIQFWGDTMLRDELRKLADAGLLITGSRKKDDGKGGRSAITYRKPDLKSIDLPSWEAITKTETTKTTEITETNETTETTDKSIDNAEVVSVSSVYSVSNQVKNVALSGGFPPAKQAGATIWIPPLVAPATIPNTQGGEVISLSSPPSKGAT
ncbi:MAG: hypothetical protein WC861_01130 [Candidatus Micrarchaeia archaeon]|jgi:hypothetical protein